jgi:hypothetical protein
MLGESLLELVVQIRYIDGQYASPWAMSYECPLLCAKVGQMIGKNRRLNNYMQRDIASSHSLQHMTHSSYPMQQMEIKSHFSLVLKAPDYGEKRCAWQTHEYKYQCS